MNEPASLISLPPELIRSIIGLVGWSSNNYSIKERQSDLAAFTLVHPSLRGPAESWLYRSPTIRNEGRAALFYRSLEEQPDLALLVRHLSYPANTQQDRASPILLNKILTKTSPNEINVGVALFQPEAVSEMAEQDELAGLLTNKRDLQSFSLSSSGVPSALGLFKAAPFLATTLPIWTNLTSLTLIGSPTIPFSVLSGPKPSYRLTKLDLSKGDFSPQEFRWLLGDTRQLVFLALQSAWAEHDMDGSPRFALHSPLHKILWSLTTLKLVHCGVSEDTVSWYSPIHILALCGPSLTHLEYGHTSFSGSQHINDFNFPKSIRHLVIHGSNSFVEIRLAEMLKEGYEALEDIVLDGQFKLSNAKYQAFAKFCQGRGIRLDLKKRFSNDQI